MISCVREKLSHSLRLVNLLDINAAADEPFGLFDTW